MIGKHGTNFWKLAFYGLNPSSHTGLMKCALFIVHITAKAPVCFAHLMNFNEPIVM